VDQDKIRSALARDRLQPLMDAFASGCAPFYQNRNWSSVQCFGCQAFLSFTHSHENGVNICMLCEGRIAVGKHGAAFNRTELLGRITSGPAARTCGYNESDNMWTRGHSRALAIPLLHAKPKPSNGLPKF
jgi:hypothetical protein